MNKKIISLAVCAMFALATTCTAGSFSNILGAASSVAQTATSGESGNSAITSGKNVGSALASLAKSYKNNGKKINFKDPTVITSLASLATNMIPIKENAKDKTFYTSFVNGMIEGSNGLIDNAAADTVIAVLSNIDFNALAKIGAKNPDGSDAASLMEILGSLIK